MVVDKHASYFSVYGSSLVGRSFRDIGLSQKRRALNIHRGLERGGRRSVADRMASAEPSEDALKLGLAEERLNPTKMRNPLSPAKAEG